MKTIQNNLSWIHFCFIKHRQLQFKSRQKEKFRNIFFLKSLHQTLINLVANCFQFSSFRLCFMDCLRRTRPLTTSTTSTTTTTTLSLTTWSPTTWQCQNRWVTPTATTSRWSAPTSSSWWPSTGWRRPCRFRSPLSSPWSRSPCSESSQRSAFNIGIHICKVTVNLGKFVMEVIFKRENHGCLEVGGGKWG